MYTKKYIDLKIELNKLKQENNKLQTKLQKKEETIDDYSINNNNQRKSFYVILNAIIHLQENNITNETLSDSLSKVFNASLCGINERNVEELFHVDEIIDGYSIAKKYSEESVSCDCPSCNEDYSTQELAEFMEAEIFSSEEFQQFYQDVEGGKFDD